MASHMFVAMLIIEQCAATPQNFTDVYGAVRNIARSMQPGSELGTAASAVSIIEKIHQARREHFDEDAVRNKWIGYSPVR